MKPPRLRASARVLLLTLAALAALPAAHAGSVTASGDVSPFPDPNPFSDPMWDTYGPLYIGRNGAGSIIVDGISPMMMSTDEITLGANAGGSGTLSVINGGKISPLGGCEVNVGRSGSGYLTIDGAGSQIQSDYSYIGRNAGSSGTATIANGGKWKPLFLYVAQGGTGSLAVTNGGTVEVTSTLYLPSLTHLSGDGVITTHGLVYGGDLVFDSTHGSSQTIAFGNGGQLQLNQNSSSDLGVGYQSATGNLTIAEGVSVYANSSVLGMAQNSVVHAVVKDADTLWDVKNLDVGSASLSSATLDITNGGRVNTQSGNIAGGAGSSGTVTIDGANSTWVNTGDLWVGSQLYLSSGTLHVNNGGSLQVGGNGFVQFQSTLTVGAGGTATVNQSLGNLGSILIDAGGSLTVNGNLNNRSSVLINGDVYITDPAKSVLINSGASIAGTGTIHGNLSFQSGAKLQFSLTDTLSVDGAVSFGGGFGIDNLLDLDANTPDGIYTLIDTTSTDFSLAGLDNWGYDGRFRLSNIGDPYKAAYFQQGSLQVVVIPEPATALLAALGVGALFLARRRRGAKEGRQP